MQLFVPGRLCLLGEHSDWAGTYCTLNPAIEPGYALVAGTRQGLYARAKRHADALIFRPALNDGSRPDPIRLPLSLTTLLSVAQQGGFASYVAGTAYQLLRRYAIAGLDIDNYRTDLPIQKGLSSSAAVCVLTVRAFNCLYDLRLSRRDEMELAYLGERTTPSQCGRLDQACAFGSRPVLMTFEGEQLVLTPLKLTRPLYLIVVDLGGYKDTQKILRDLHRSYPVAANAQQRQVQRYLGAINAGLVQQAAAALQQGDAQRLGELMTQAQAEFDRALVPACPDQLTAPKLHRLLTHPALQPYCCGGKGVGSQGDGTAQLVARDRDSQARAIALIQQDFPDMQALEVTLMPTAKIKKAVIPAAGFGTRLFPATKAVKKELLPIIDSDGRAKPVILKIVEEAVSAGIEEIGIVVQKDSLAEFQAFFQAPPSPQLWAKLSPENQAYSQYLQALGERIAFIFQSAQEGFGHAVFCARDWVNHEPFLLLLGDHVYRSQTAQSCAAQLVDRFEQCDCSVIGLTTMSVDIIHKAGCVTGTWQTPQTLLEISELCEKPSLDYAQANLRVPGLSDSEFLGVFGQYALTPAIFEQLELEISNNLRQRGEFQLTTCLERLRAAEGMLGYRVKGDYFDVGMPQFYQQTLQAFYRP
ncbi:MAG: NTP transferase domain-containing protein [Leptolyngbya sp. SIO4C1]|nr:NTP transferase domain-containing protein [Leptolyngbya sp. SIO4C1]